jgi:hypothetical protein
MSNTSQQGNSALVFAHAFSSEAGGEKKNEHFAVTF